MEVIYRMAIDKRLYHTGRCDQVGEHGNLHATRLFLMSSVFYEGHHPPGFFTISLTIHE
jgi:hypothetical protein